jgi:arylsulfatase A-like enzyme
MKTNLTRRDFLAGTARTAAVGALAAAHAQASSAEAASPPPAAGRPNILWICTDQQRYDTIAALGHKHVHTPNIDKLVETGVAFTHAHCQTPICTASRAGFLTGMYPTTVHACMNGSERWANAAPLITKTLAEAGYDCGLAGKLHLSAAQGRVEKRPDDGYRVFYWSHHPDDDWGQSNAYIAWLASKGHDYNALRKQHGYIPAALHQTTWCGEMAAEFIRQRRSGPWLFSLNCFAPHPPFAPPKEYLDRYPLDAVPPPLFRASDLQAQARLKPINFQTTALAPDQYDARLNRARYWAEIELIDENIGRLRETLRQTGQLDNTIIILTSDHGEMLGDHGLRQKGCRFYEGLVRVPLIFSWPARFQQGLRSDALVELTDIVPTLLQTLGLPVASRIQGRCLLPILEGKADPHRHRDLVRCEYFGALGGPQTRATMIRSRRYKLVTYHGHGLGELFDLENDPGEFDNLWDDPKHADVRFEMLLKNFDTLAFAVDVGPERVAAF